MKLLGYILDEDDFEVTPTVNRTMVAMEIDENKITTDVVFNTNKKGNVAVYSFVFKPKTNSTFSFIAKYEISFSQLTEIVDLSRITIIINGFGVFDGLILTSPINVNENDVVTIKIYKTYLATGMFKLIGTTA